MIDVLRHEYAHVVCSALYLLDRGVALDRAEVHFHAAPDGHGETAVTIPGQPDGFQRRIAGAGAVGPVALANEGMFRSVAKGLTWDRAGQLSDRDLELIHKYAPAPDVQRMLVAGTRFYLAEISPQKMAKAIAILGQATAFDADWPLDLMINQDLAKAALRRARFNVGNLELGAPLDKPIRGLNTSWT